MPSQKFVVGDVKGLTPAIEPTQSEEIFALSGRNFVFDSKGAKSAFGNRMLSPIPRAKPNHIQGMRLKLKLGDRCFTIDGDGIWEWREDLGDFQSIYLIDTGVTYYRWTWGFLAGLMYFAHPAAGLLVYDLDSGFCLPHQHIGGVGTPQNVIATVTNNGRLGVLTSQMIAWSAAGDGLDFEPKIGGAGFQLLNDRVSGEPIMLTGYAGGLLSWTTGGILKSEFTGDREVYRHRDIGTEYRPVNSFCAARVDDNTTIILDERGLFQSQGDRITPFSPVFNEFLIDYIQRNNINIGQNVRIDWDDLQRRLYVSLSLSYASPSYERTFVLYSPLDKWGSFDEPHNGIFPLRITGSSRADDYFGFSDSAGRIRMWTATGNREAQPEDSELNDLNLWQPTLQIPLSYQSGTEGVIVSSSGRLRDVGTGGTVTGFYEVGASVPAIPQVTGLDAKLNLGLFRPLGPNAPDQASEIIGLMVRNVLTRDSNIPTLDFNLVPDATANEDYNLGLGSEDYGEGLQNYVNHQLKVISTLDGVSEFQSAEPMLVAFTEGARHYSCSTVGMWHIVEIRADEVGEYFHLKSCEITAISAGRIL